VGLHPAKSDFLIRPESNTFYREVQDGADKTAQVLQKLSGFCSKGLRLMPAFHEHCYSRHSVL